MAVTKIKGTSSFTNLTKYDSFTAGYPSVMAAPTATDGGTGSTVNVAFTAQAGATSYTALSTPGSFTGTGSSSPVTVSGLTAGTAYIFQIRANNAEGSGAYSAASNSVTPAVPVSYESIATLSGTGSSGTLTFSSIPSGYVSLQIRAFSRTDTSGFSERMRFNGDTGSNYADHYITGDGSAYAGGGASIPYMRIQGSGNDASNAYVSIINIHNYASTSQNKTARIFGGLEINGAGSSVSLNSGLWMNTSAITSITIFLASGNYTTNARFALYGIKG